MKTTSIEILVSVELFDRIYYLRRNRLSLALEELEKENLVLEDSLSLLVIKAIQFSKLDDIKNIEIRGKEMVVLHILID